MSSIGFSVSTRVMVLCVLSAFGNCSLLLILVYLEVICLPGFRDSWARTSGVRVMGFVYILCPVARTPKFSVIPKEFANVVA